MYATMYTCDSTRKESSCKANEARTFRSKASYAASRRTRIKCAGMTRAIGRAWLPGPLGRAGKSSCTQAGSHKWASASSSSMLASACKQGSRTISCSGVLSLVSCTIVQPNQDTRYRWDAALLAHHNTRHSCFTHCPLGKEPQCANALSLDPRHAGTFYTCTS